MDMKMWHEEAKGVIRELRELAALTADENGAHRVAWTPVWDRAISWFQEKMIRAGAEITVDAANNVWAKLPGESAEGVLIGSHLVVDMLTEDRLAPYGIPLGAPFAETPVRGPVALLPAWDKTALADLARPGNLRALGIEFGAGLAFALGAGAAKRSWTRRPAAL